MEFSYTWDNEKRMQAGRSVVEAENEEAAREKLARVWPARRIFQVVPLPQTATFDDEGA